MQLSQKKALAPFLSARSIVASGICHDGTLLLVLTDQPSLQIPNRISPDGPPPYVVSVLHIGDEVIDETDIQTEAISFTSVQLFADDSILLHAGEPLSNTSVYDQQGNLLTKFAIGAAIDCQVSRTDEIWAAYYDEATVGAGIAIAQGINNEVATAQASGLACFDRSGGLKFSFKPAPGFDPMMDCSALNVSDDFVWTSYYPGFPIVRMDASRALLSWPTQMDGIVRALAQTREHVLVLVDTAVNDSWYFVYRICSDGSMKLVHRLRAELPRAEKFANTFHCRGSTLNMVLGSKWLQLDLKNLP